MSLPAATNRGRRFIVQGRRGQTEIISQFYKVMRMYEARFSTRRVYTTPDEAPSFARLTFSLGRWHGDILLQEFATTEVEALERLQETLHALGFEAYVQLTRAIEELKSQHPLVGGSRG